MSARFFRLASAAALLAPCVTIRAQAPGARPLFTGACATSESFVDLDDVVAEPEHPATVAAMGDMPVPPAELRTKSHELKLVAAFVVDSSGSVRKNTTTIMSSNDSALNRWACDVVPRMRFTAALHHGRAVATQVMMPFAFRAPMVTTEHAPTGERPYLEIEVEKQVTLDRPVFPQYPPDVKKEMVEGRVLAQFVVDTTGHAEMSTFHVLRTNDTRFIEPVRHAVAASTFHPAEFHGRKVRQMVQQPFTFALGPD